MNQPPDLPPLREVIRQHKLTTRKSLGQNFILDLNITERIARAADICSNDTVLEVGPGPGGLTRALLERGAQHIVAIERDSRCLPALEEIAMAFPGRLTFIEGDALTMGLAEAAPLLESAKSKSAKLAKPKPSKIVSNLPYNIATPLLTRWLLSQHWPPWWSSLTLMLQREVAKRITAQPGTRTYGRLSVISQWRTHPRVIFNVNPQAFTPPPAVTSTVVHFEPIAYPFDVPSDALERVTAVAFGQRRKMLRNSLKTLTKDLETLLDDSGLDSSYRAENLTPEDFCHLTRALITQQGG
ncbi:MAG: 16S rRNA (adenine(1518)-N(6)/adenine(1519)-N(6))-dimethyltransferase RsmA [Parvularculales bacterium]